MQSTEFVTLKQVHDDFQDAANLTRYYNLCAYLTGKFFKVFLIIEIVTKCGITLLSRFFIKNSVKSNFT